MKQSSSRRPPTYLFVLITCCIWLISPVDAINLLESKSLDTCMEHSAFSASYFNVRFTPNNNSITVRIKGNSGVSGKVLLDTEVLAYGYPVFRKVIDPCDGKTLRGFCPMNPAPFELPFNAEVPKEHLKMIPTSIYNVPDLDATIRIFINSTDHHPLACVQATLSNGRTVHQVAVSWVVAIIAFVALALSSISFTLGHFSSAAYLLSDSLSIFGYYQSLAFIGMTSVRTTPIVRAWTQNFQWSVGIIRLDFLQDLATWYQRATGGTPTTLRAKLNSISVHVERRDLFSRMNEVSRSVTLLKSLKVSGIEKVGFLSGIEKSNLFLTVYTFFIISILSAMAVTALARFVYHECLKRGIFEDNTMSTRNKDWKVTMNGNLFLILVLTFPSMVAMCLWEFTKRDSACELVLAILSLLVVVSLILWAAFRVIRLGQRSIKLHSNPAYILYSNPEALVNYGVFYIPFRTSWYFSGFLLLVFSLFEASFIGLAQESATSQAVAILIIELVKLTLMALIKPYMDSRTNAINIAIATIGLINAILLALFTRDFGLPDLGIGIMGAIFFFINIFFLFVLIALLIFTVLWTLLSYSPNRRCKATHDDRNSFMTLGTRLANTQPDHLGISTIGLIRAQKRRLETPDMQNEQQSEVSSNASTLEHTHQTPAGKGVLQGGVERTYASLRSLNPMVRSGGRNLRSVHTL